MSDLRENLKTEFQEPEYRYGYAESFLNTKLATQIKTLREQRDYTQEEVAALMGIKQPGYRRFEDVNHVVWKTDTLWNIARVYGVRLDISFKTFGSLLDDKERFDKEGLRVPAFEEDPAFKEPAIKEPKLEETLAKAAVPNCGLLDLIDHIQQEGAAPYLDPEQGNVGLADISWLGNSLDVANQVAARYRGMNEATVAESKSVAQTIPEAGSSKGAISGATGNIQSSSLTGTHRAKVIEITVGRRSRTARRYARTSRSYIRGA